MKNKLTKEMIGMEKISPSALMCYLDSPRLFYYKYWLQLKLPDQDKRHLEFGNAFHSAIGNVYNQYDDNFKAGWKYSEVSIAIDTFDEKFKIGMITDEEFERVKKMKSNTHSTKQELYDFMRAQGVKLIRSFWEIKDSLFLDHEIDIVDSEVPSKFIMVNPDDPEDQLPIPLSLRIDFRTRGKKKIVELKSSSSKYDEKETREKIQGRSYAFAQFAEDGTIPGVDYVVGVKSTGEIQHIPLVYDKADMSKFYHEIESILQKIANREFDRGKPFSFTKMELEHYEKALGLIE
jgi:hypothetical protein